MKTWFWLEIKFGAYILQLRLHVYCTARPLSQFQSFSGNKDKTMVSMIRFPDIVTELSSTILDVHLLMFRDANLKE